MHLQKYLKMLVQDHNRFVAMCEEFRRDDSLNAKTFERRVVRIVTPGTLIDEPFLNPYENNFLLSVSPIPLQNGALEKGIATADTPIGLAWIDVSTGEFYTKRTTVGGLRDEVVRINPKEVVLDTRLRDDETNTIRRTVVEEQCFVSYFSTPQRSSDGLGASPIIDKPSSDDVAAQIDVLRRFNKETAVQFRGGLYVCL